MDGARKDRAGFRNRFQTGTFPKETNYIIIPKLTPRLWDEHRVTIMNSLMPVLTGLSLDLAFRGFGG